MATGFPFRAKSKSTQVAHPSARPIHRCDGRQQGRIAADYPSPMDLPEIEQRLRELVGSIPEPGRAEILRILTIRDDAERAREVGHLHRSGVLPVTAELLIDAEEEPALRAALVGMLREAQT